MFKLVQVFSNIYSSDTVYLQGLRRTELRRASYYCYADRARSILPGPIIKNSIRTILYVDHGHLLIIFFEYVKFIQSVLRYDNRGKV